MLSIVILWTVFQHFKNNTIISKFCTTFSPNIARSLKRHNFNLTRNGDDMPQLGRQMHETYITLLRPDEYNVRSRCITADHIVQLTITSRGCSTTVTHWSSNEDTPSYTFSPKTEITMCRDNGAKVRLATTYWSAIVKIIINNK